MGESDRVVGDDFSNVYEKCVGRPIWSGAVGDEW